MTNPHASNAQPDLYDVYEGHLIDRMRGNAGSHWPTASPDSRDAWVTRPEHAKLGADSVMAVLSRWCDAAQQGSITRLTPTSVRLDEAAVYDAVSHAISYTQVGGGTAIMTLSPNTTYAQVARLMLAVS